MGSLVSAQQEDLRPQLRVTLKKITQLANNSMDDEMDVYVQMTYGKLKQQAHKHGKITATGLFDEMRHGRQPSPKGDTEVDAELDRAGSIEGTEAPNMMSRSTLSVHSVGTDTRLSEVISTDRTDIIFNETYWFPVLSIGATHSLEISVWDKELGPQITDDYLGKTIVYYAKYENDWKFENESSSYDEHRIPKYFLPKEWNEIKTLKVDFKDTMGNIYNGLVEIEVEFQQRKSTQNVSYTHHDHDEIDGNGDGKELDNDSYDSGKELLSNDNDSIGKEKKQRRKSSKKKTEKGNNSNQNKRGSRKHVEYPQSSCCGGCEF